MNVIRYIDRLKRMHNLIRRKATGDPSEFAARMSVSRSSLMEYIRCLRSMGGPVKYSPDRKSYYYENEVNFSIGYQKKLEDDDMELLEGGYCALSFQSII